MLYDGRVWLYLVMYVVGDVVVYLEHYLQMYDGRVWLCMMMWSVMLSSWTTTCRCRMMVGCGCAWWCGR